MARSDLLCDLIKYGLAQDNHRFIQTAEAVSADERRKQHTVLADRVDSIIQSASLAKRNAADATRDRVDGSVILRPNPVGAQSLVIEKTPERTLDSLVLPDSVLELCRGFIEEQHRADLLRSYGLAPRHRLLLVGPPGNGKTSLAEAIADELLVPFYTVRYEQLIGSYLGETAGRLDQLFSYVRSRPCVLFFDEFETLGKERGDTHETGEIKRVVSSLLLQIDALPSYVVVIAATNHDALLDKAAWRRFQVRVELPKPTRANLSLWIALFEQRTNFSLGLEPETIAKRVYGCSYAELEELAIDVYRQYILGLPSAKAKDLTTKALRLWSKQRKPKTTTEEVAS